MNSECYGCENFEIINGQEVCVKKYSNISCPKFKPCVDYEMMYIYHNAKEDSIRRK